MNDATMEEAITDQDTKIAMIVAMSGATKEEATRALDENGGNVNQAVAQVLGKDQAAKQQEEEEEEDTKPAAKSMKTSYQVCRPDDADDAGGKSFAAYSTPNKKPEYSPSTEYTDMRGQNGK